MPEVTPRVQENVVTVQTGQKEAIPVQPQAIDKNMAAMVQKEKQMREMQTKVAQERDQLKAKIQEYETNYIPKSKLLENPYQTLTEIGVPYDKVTEQAIQALGSEDPVKKLISSLESKITALEKGQETVQKSMSDAQTQAYQGALKQIGADAKELAASDPRFELVAMDPRGIPAVVSLIEAEFNKTGEVMSVEKACAEVDAELESQWKQISAAKRFAAQTIEKQKPEMKTLTNQVGQSTKPLSRKERAVLAFQGKLA